MLSESVHGRAWHAARQAALGPGLTATALARRPYDLRHAALSLWLNATGAPVEVAARAGDQRPCHARCLPALHQRPGRYYRPADPRRPRRRRQRDIVVTIRKSERLHAPSAPPQTLSAICTRTSPRSRAQPTAARPGQPGSIACGHPPLLLFPQVRRHLGRYPQRPGDAWIRPTHSPQNKADGFWYLSFCAEKPVTPFGVTGSDLGFCVAGVGFEPT